MPRTSPGTEPRDGDGEASAGCVWRRHPRRRRRAWTPRRTWPSRARTASDALWQGALEDEVARATQSGAPLSLLIVELADAERVVAIEGRLGAGATLGRFARAVRSAVRRGDILACESDTRAWIIATNTGRLGAQALADRVAAAVRAAEPWRGAPLGVSAGVAVFREDGGDVGELIEAAEEARFAAEASGMPVVRDGGPLGQGSGVGPDVDPAS